jgi:hypothetical protein
MQARDTLKGWHMQWTGLAILAVGVWLIIAPFALGYSALDAAVVNDGAFGVLIAGFAAYSMVAPWRLAEAFTWLATAAGVWVGFAPFLLGYGAWQGADLGRSAAPYLAGYPDRAIVNDLVAGFSVVVLGLMQALTFRTRLRA